MKPRYKIDAIEAYYGMHDRPRTVALFRRRWYGWQRIQCFEDAVEAERAFRMIQGLPIYFT